VIDAELYRVVVDTTGRTLIMAMGNVAFADCRALAGAVEKTGGTVPANLQNLLAGFDDLSTQTVQPSDPTRAILDVYAEGKPERAAKLITAAAQIEHDAEYRKGLRQRAEVLFVERFYRELCGGAADQILDSLRPGFDSAAQVLEAATAAVDINANPAQLAETGTIEQLEAWRSIRPAVAKLDACSGIARAFGPRSINVGVLDQPPLIDPIDLVDEAVMCSADDLVQAGKAFRARRADISTCPWLRITPKLNAITEAEERLRAWAEVEWDLLNAPNKNGGYIDEDGNIIPVVRPNPYAPKESAAR
jgi:hypothetical protein